MTDGIRHKKKVSNKGHEWDVNGILMRMDGIFLDIDGIVMGY